MKTIWKFPIEVKDEQSVSMPAGAKILCVQVQHGQPCVWAEVDDKRNKEKRTIYVFGTGHPLPNESLLYIGTFQIHGGSLVFHVYE